MTPQSQSPEWNRSTKIIVAVGTLLFVVLVLQRFRVLIGPLVIAGMIAYLLNPLVVWIAKHTRLSRNLVIVLVYLVFVLAVLGVLTAVGVALYEQALALIKAVPRIVEVVPLRISEVIGQTYVIGPWTIELAQLNVDVEQLADQVVAAIQPALSRGGRVLGTAASATASWVGWALFILVISFYATKDLSSFGAMIGDVAQQPGYRHDVERLLREFGRIWNAYLRGQAILGAVMAALVGSVLLVLGVRYALVLGLIAGLLEFLPIIGPVVAVALSVFVALFQESNWLGLDPIWFAVVVLAVGVVIQQLENNVLVPRIVGEALDLHPIIVMVGAIMGGSLAGVLGIMLSAPVLATVKLVGGYAWRKMFDLDPFPYPEAAGHAGRGPTVSTRVWQMISKLGRRQAAAAEKSPD